MLVRNAGGLRETLRSVLHLGSKEGPALLNEARMTKVVGAFDEGNVQSVKRSMALTILLIQPPRRGKRPLSLSTIGMNIGEKR